MTLQKLEEILKDGDTFLVKLPNKLKAMLEVDSSLLTQTNPELGSIIYQDTSTAAGNSFGKEQPETCIPMKQWL